MHNIYIYYEWYVKKKLDNLWYTLQFVVSMLNNIARRKSNDILIL